VAWASASGSRSSSLHLSKTLLGDTAQGRLATFTHLRDADYGKLEDAKMSRLIAIAVLMVAVAAPAFACDGNKSAATDSRSTVASHSGKQAQPGRS
jgi:hypothetical protein